MTIERISNRFHLISDKLSETGINLHPEIVKGEMHRLWGQVNEGVVQFSERIPKIDSDVFKGLFPLVVHRARVYVSETISTIHTPINLDYPQVPLDESPVGGFLWKFKIPFSRVLSGIYEEDTDVVFDHFPIEQILEDRVALQKYLKENNILSIGKGSYSPR